MSDYMFMLDSHLSSEQSLVVEAVQSVVSDAGISLFLTGGAMRDMMGGFPIRDLDFTVEDNPLKLTRALTQRTGAEIVETDTLRKRVELHFPGNVTAEIGMARTQRYPKAGGKPQVTPATIHDDLRGRDFTVNAIALSLNRASRGLLLDPTNGLGDIQLRELRANSNYLFYDDPSRLLRLIRLKTRLNYTVEERTGMQYANVRQAGMESRIPPETLFRELRQMAEEPNPAALLEALEKENLLPLFCRALAGPKLNLAGMQRLQKAKQHVPFGVPLAVDNFSLFLEILGEPLNPSERQMLVKSSAIERSWVRRWQKVEPAAKKLERELKSAKLQKPSQVYAVVAPAAGELVLFLLMKSDHRLVHDRLKNYLQKYVPAAQEVIDAEVAASSGAQPGTPKFKKAKAEAVVARLDSRPRKPPPPEPEAVVVPAKR
jgi:tRNA nucleotidyltransferase (CCA-adding enzyme)